MAKKKDLIVDSSNNHYLYRKELKIKEKYDTGRLRYKCRNCGDEFMKESVSSYSNMMLTLIELIHAEKIGLTSHLYGQIPHIREMHSCDNGDTGVADLICLRGSNGD